MLTMTAFRKIGKSSRFRDGPGVVSILVFAQKTREFKRTHKCRGLLGILQPVCTIVRFPFDPSTMRLIWMSLWTQFVTQLGAWYAAGEDCRRQAGPCKYGPECWECGLSFFRGRYLLLVVLQESRKRNAAIFWGVPPKTDTQRQLVGGSR